MVDTGKLDVAVELDLDELGNYGESWMAFSKETQMLYVLAASFKIEGRVMSGNDPNANAKSESQKSSKNQIGR